MKLKQVQLADLLQVHRTRISKHVRDGRLVVENGLYDTSDPVNWTFLCEFFHRKHREAFPPAEEVESLEQQKLQEEVLYLQARRSKTNVATAQVKGDLVPKSLALQAWGAFGNSVRNNILTIGKKVARGDVVLQERIERATTQAIEKTLERAHAEIERISFIPIKEVDDEDETLNGK